MTFGREIDRGASFRLMEHAVKLGITHFDTAAAYAAGASEAVVGEWLATTGNRPAIDLATKLVPPYSATTLPEQVQHSLDRLRSRTIDLLYLHRWDPTAVAPEFLAALSALVVSGRVRRLGASNFTLPQLRSAVAAQAEIGAARFQALQNVQNVALRSIDADTARYCAEHGIALVTYSPLGAGYLTGKYATGIPAGTRFDIVPGHQPLYFTAESRRRLAALQALATRSDLPVVDLALAWALHQPFPATVLVGGRTPAHLDQAIRAAALDRPDLFAALSAA